MSVSGAYEWQCEAQRHVHHRAGRSRPTAAIVASRGICFRKVVFQDPQLASTTRRSSSAALAHATIDYRPIAQCPAPERAHVINVPIYPPNRLHPTPPPSLHRLGESVSRVPFCRTAKKAASPYVVFFCWGNSVERGTFHHTTRLGLCPTWPPAPACRGATEPSLPIACPSLRAPRWLSDLPCTGVIFRRKRTSDVPRMVFEQDGWCMVAASCW